MHARFWDAVADACAGRAAIFCYNLMNEPVLAGSNDPGDWLPGEGLAGLHYVKRITLDLAGRSRREVARAWVDTLVEAIRRTDSETLVTVGVIPWVFHFGGGSPLFYSEEVRENLDFASVHFYPRHGEVDTALEALAVYDVGMPLVVEEMAPLRCTLDELDTFIRRSRPNADGWLGFFWGGDIAHFAEAASPLDVEPYRDWDHEDWLAYFEEHGEEVDETLREAVIAALMRDWLTYFRDAAPRVLGLELKSAG